MRDCTTTCLCEGIYMLGEVPAPHSPSGGAAVLHPIGAQLIPTVQENAKDRYINKDTSGAYAAGWPRPPPCARARRAGPPQRGHHGVACTREDPARKPGASPAVGKRGRPPKRGLERAGARVGSALPDEASTCAVSNDAGGRTSGALRLRTPQMTRVPGRRRTARLRMADGTRSSSAAPGPPDTWDSTAVPGNGVGGARA